MLFFSGVSVAPNRVVLMIVNFLENHIITTGKLQWFQEYYGLYYVILGGSQHYLHPACHFFIKKKKTLSFLK